MTFIQSSIGKKFLMAITGLLLVGFVLGHMAGNLLIFLGQDALNAYALKLHKLGGLLWVARGVLLLSVAIHIVTAILLTKENRRAKGQGYAAKNTKQTTLAGRTMVLSGLVVLAYIIFHLMHFTWRVTHPEYANLVDAHGHMDVYTMVVMGFQDVAISVVYLVSLFLLMLHLNHGIGSVVQTLGLNNRKTVLKVQQAGRALSVLIFIGYSSIPVAVLSGWVKLPGVTQ